MVIAHEDKAIVRNRVTCSNAPATLAQSLPANFPAGPRVSFRICRSREERFISDETSVTDLEIDEAIREAWAVLQAGAPPSARQLAAALLAVTTGTCRPSLHGLLPMTCGGTGWRSWRPGRLAGGLGSPAGESRAAGCPPPYCQKPRRGARTLISCGARRCDRRHKASESKTARQPRSDAGITPDKRPPQNPAARICLPSGS